MRNHIIRLLSIVALSTLTMSVSHAAKVYKCKNAQGKMLYQKTPCTDTSEVTSWIPKTEVKAPEPEPIKKTNEIIVIKQGPGGHYFLEGEVNTHGLTFVIDTGATTVTLPRAIAKTASLVCNDKVMMQTANGLSQGCTTTITELKLGKGNLVLKNVTAVISPKLSQPLLGMNVLQNFNIEQKDKEMQISERDAKKSE